MASISQISQVKCWFAQFTVSVAKEKLFQSNFSLQLDFIASKNTGFIATQIRDNCHLEPDHVRLTLLNRDTISVLALNKKLKFPIHFQLLVFWLPMSIAHDPVLK